MRILLLDFTLGGHHAEYAAHLARGMAAAGDDVILATSDSGIHAQRFARLSAGSAELAQLPLRHRTSLLGRLHRIWHGLHAGFEIAEKRDVDVLHHLYLDGAEIPWALLRTPKKSRWRNFGTLFWLPHVPFHLFPSPSVIHSAIRLRALGRAGRTGNLEGVFVHSDRIRTGLVDSLGSGLPTITVIPDPTVTPETSDAVSARRRLGLPSTGRLVLFFGGLRPDKGVDIFCEALAHVRTDDWFAVIAGEPLGVSSEDVDVLCSRLPEGKRLITRLEFIPDAEVMDYFVASDVVVLPYRQRFRGTSGVLQRAASVGTPVIATDVGDVGPAARMHSLGVVVPPESPKLLGDAIQRFLTERAGDGASLLRTRAERYAAAHHWEIGVGLIRDAYLA